MPKIGSPYREGWWGTGDETSDVIPHHRGDWESQGYSWFAPEEMAQLPLQSGFASNWNSGPLTKGAKHGFFYHTAPRKYRERIEREGLQPTHDSPESPWANEKWRNEMTEPQPSGVYLWDDARNAKGYAGLLQRKTSFPYPGDEEEYYYETQPYEEYEQAYPGNRDPEYNEPIDQDDYDEYMSRYVHQPEPLYDIWKVNTSGFEPQIDPETALLHGGWQSPERAQQEIEAEHNRWQEVNKTEGHRWYLPHAVDPSRLTLHDHVYPADLTQRNTEEYEAPKDRMIPNQWSRVPFDQWSENARKRYLGDPEVMREIDPQDRTSRWHESKSGWVEVIPR